MANGQGRVVKLSYPQGSVRSLGLIHWWLGFSESRGAQILSPDWLPRLDVNWGWGRHITGEDVNPHMKGSLRAQNQDAGAC